MENVTLIQSQTDTVAALLNQAASETVYLRTGVNANGVLESFIDALKTPIRPLRFNTQVTLDYSYQGQLYIVKGSIIETTAPHHAIIGISQSDMERIHTNYGAKVREVLGNVDDFLAKGI